MIQDYQTSRMFQDSRGNGNSVLLLRQLDRRANHFKSSENSKSIVWEILNYIL